MMGLVGRIHIRNKDGDYFKNDSNIKYKMKIKREDRSLVEEIWLHGYNDDTLYKLGNVYQHLSSQFLKNKIKYRSGKIIDVLTTHEIEAFIIPGIVAKRLITNKVITLDFENWICDPF